MATVPMHGGEARLTVKAGAGGITEGQLIKASALDGMQLTAVAAVATNGADGIAAEAAAQGELTTMVMLVPGTLMEVQAEAGVTVGAPVKVSANGKVEAATVPSVNNAATDDGFLIVGRALTATAGGKCMILVR